MIAVILLNFHFILPVSNAAAALQESNLLWTTTRKRVRPDHKTTQPCGITEEPQKKSRSSIKNVKVRHAVVHAGTGAPCCEELLPPPATVVTCLPFVMFG